MIADIALPCSRREARRTGRRDAILDAAQISFMVNGYAGTTMSQIAKALGGSKGTLWSYFPSKDLLFAAVVERAGQQFRLLLSSIFNPHDDIEEVLLRFAGEFLQKITSPEAVALNRLVIGEASRFPEAGRIFYDRAVGRTQELVASYLADAMERGLLRRDEPKRAAQHLIGLCSYRCQYEQQFGLVVAVDPETRQRDAQEGVAIFLRAYAKSQ